MFEYAICKCGCGCDIDLYLHPELCENCESGDHEGLSVAYEEQVEEVDW